MMSVVFGGPGSTLSLRSLRLCVLLLVWCLPHGPPQTALSCGCHSADPARFVCVPRFGFELVTPWLLAAAARMMMLAPCPRPLLLPPADLFRGCDGWQLFVRRVDAAAAAPVPARRHGDARGPVWGRAPHADSSAGPERNPESYAASGGGPGGCRCIWRHGGAPLLGPRCGDGGGLPHGACGRR